MHTNVFLAIAAVLSTYLPANGGDPPKHDAEVAKLVKDLGSPRFAVREAAQKMTQFFQAIEQLMKPNDIDNVTAQLKALINNSLDSPTMKHYNGNALAAMGNNMCSRTHCHGDGDIVWGK